MDSETKGWCFFFACSAIVLVTLISCVTYYNIEDNKILERLVDKGINPLVVRCIDSDWSRVSEYVICSRIIENNNLTKEQAEALIEDMKNNGR